MADNKLLTKDQVSEWIDRAAMAAMQGLLASDTEDTLASERAGELAYLYAEALWARRNKGRTEKL